MDAERKLVPWAEEPLEIVDVNDPERGILAFLKEAIEEPVPNERCAECGFEVENSHYTCHGHQTCLPECPECGGSLEPLV